MNPTISYLESSIPEGVTIAAYRATRPKPRRRFRIAELARRIAR
jgi:hypothetical protein